MSINLFLATEDGDRQAIFRLRYDVYVSEMHVHQPNADHAARAIEEPLDEHADLIAASMDGNIVGTVRLSCASQEIGDYAQLYGVARYQRDARAMCIVTKLMVRPDVRGTAVALALCKKVYALALQRGYQLAFIDCLGERLPLFQRLGFREQLPCFTHPATRLPHHRLVLDLENLAYMRRCRSPLLSVALEHHAQRCAAAPALSAA